MGGCPPTPPTRGDWLRPRWSWSIGGVATCLPVQVSRCDLLQRWGMFVFVKGASRVWWGGDVSACNERTLNFFYLFFLHLKRSPLCFCYWYMALILKIQEFWFWLMWTQGKGTHDIRHRHRPSCQQLLERRRMTHSVQQFVKHADNSSKSVSIFIKSVDLRAAFTQEISQVTSYKNDNS